MNNRPQTLSQNEIEEIAGLLDIQEMWGATSKAEMAQLLERDVYAVKFNYHASSPGYIGDYYILQGDALGEAVELIRDQDHELKLI